MLSPKNETARAGEQRAEKQNSSNENHAKKTTNTQVKTKLSCTNQEFIKAVFGQIDAAFCLWICSFKSSPDSENVGWGGKSYKLHLSLKLPEENNNYFSVAVLDFSSRKKSNFRRMAVLVLDDPDISKLPVNPSYILETSPGKYQVGFIINDTEESRDSAYCSRALNILAKRHLINADKSGNNIVRYVRLPVGTNTKKREAGNFQHCLQLWQPSRKFNLPDILKALGIDLSSADTAPKSKSKAKQQAEIIESQLDVRQSIEDIMTGDNFHDGLVRLAARYAARGMQRDDIEYTLIAAMNASAAKEYDKERWQARMAEIPSAIDSAIAKYGNEFAGKTALHTTPLNLFPDALGTPPIFSFEDYPEVIADLAKDVSKRTGADPVIPAWTAIAVATALIHDKHKLQVKALDNRWLESARLWIGFVGEPATKKSPAMSEVLSTIQNLQAKWYQEYIIKYEQWEIKAAAAEKQKLPKPKRPHLQKCFVNDTTLEALADILEYNNGGVLALHDELSGWFGSMDCYRQKGISKDRPAWLTAYNGGEHHIDRAGKQPRYIKNFSVSLVGGIQPDPMRRIASQLGDDGLLQRFIMLPINLAEKGEDAKPDAMAHEKWNKLCDYLSSYEEIPALITLSPEAQKIINESRKQLHALGQNPAFNKKLQAALQKGEGQLARLTLIFHIIENRDGCNFACLEKAPSAVVNATTATKAARLYLQFIVPNMIRFYHDVIGDSEEMRSARLIAGFILAHNKEYVTEREIYRAHRDFRGEGRPRLLKAMEQLEMAGWLSPQLERPGRPPNTWLVNPRVHADFAELAAKERQRRDAAKVSIQSTVELSRLSLND